MLKLVLEKGYVDQELLEHLTEEQQEMLFQKIREDQIRKYNEREAEWLKKEMNQTFKTERKTKIQFLEGADGNPWVWIMGEHPDDLSYEEMIRKREAEAEENERQRARKEAEELAKQEVILAANKESSEDGKQQPFPRSESSIEFAETDGPELEVRRKSKAMNLWQKAVDSRVTLVKNMTEEEKAAYEKRRADELYENMLRRNELSKKRAADVVLDIIEHWRKSEAKAKAIELERKRSLKNAKEKLKQKGVDESIFNLPEEKKKELTRKISQRSVPKPAEHKDYSAMQKPKSMWRQTSFAAKDTKPKSLDHACRWFKESQVPINAGREQDGSISLWFHGAINRATAERTLLPKPAGMYLVRLSNKIWGYTISVKTFDAIKHYIVDCTTPLVYKFIGKHQPEFSSLTGLLTYYKVNPITWKGQEVLLLPCEQPFEQLPETNKLFQNDADEDSTLL